MIRIGLVDGALAQDWPGLAEQSWFCQADGSQYAQGHASAMAETLQTRNSRITLFNAVVFPGQLSTSVQTICDALDWLIENPPEIVLCSFGMARTSVELSVKINSLQQAGSLIVASAPARGQPVYPAAIDGVISVQGDARCAPDELSQLDLPQASFGACPVATRHPDIRGASAAAAHMACLLAETWQGSASATLEALAPAIRYHGRERRIA